MVKPGMSDNWPEVLAAFEAAINRLQRDRTLRAQKIWLIATGPTQP